MGSSTDYRALAARAHAGGLQRKMHRDGDLGKKDFGNRVVWWAALDSELHETADEENYLSMDELDEQLGG